jgi:hypothetical protein
MRRISIARQAAVQMLDNPTTNAGAAPTATTLTSLWQTDSVGIRVDRFINWQRVRAIARIDSVDYLTEGSPVGSPA